ncbi:phospholipase C [Metallosphaera yellowstonensis MK1]|jgi:phospholipase C|uniref:Phospholipase C n=1 Tax=Metallosphaera yellowstonensis MK1 TaxID=671065 RepID=H2C0G2_9CREN|nr:phospholipase C [Metallosphaera yellowstonensis MK1]
MKLPRNKPALFIVMLTIIILSILNIYANRMAMTSSHDKDQILPCELHPVYNYSTTYENNYTATPFKHVIILILENHAFDNIFGVYPYGIPQIFNNVTNNVMKPVNLIFSNNGSSNYNYGESISGLHYAPEVIQKNPGEGYYIYHSDWNYGAMNGFLNFSGPQSLTFLSYQQVPLFWDYAEEYVLADSYFSPVLSVTQPNRVAYLTGYPTQLTEDDKITGIIPLQNSILYQLSFYNISWGYFDYGYTPENAQAPFPLEVFSDATGFKEHYFNTSQFLFDLQHGELPSVSWVMFTGGTGYDTHPDSLDMHPPANLTISQINLYNVINAIMKSPYWNTSVIFVTFDEGGGFYDQIPPPIIYTYGEGYSPFLSKYGITNYSTLGQRVPLLIISPYSKEGWINNYSLSGYSILGFIEYNWRLPYITQIVANSDVPGILQSFNFEGQLRKPIIITDTNWTYPIPLQFPVHYGYIAYVEENYTGYLILYNKGLISDSSLRSIMMYGTMD